MKQTARKRFGWRSKSSIIEFCQLPQSMKKGFTRHEFTRCHPYVEQRNSTLDYKQYLQCLYYDQWEKSIDALIKEIVDQSCYPTHYQNHIEDQLWDHQRWMHIAENSQEISKMERLRSQGFIKPSHQVQLTQT